MEFQIIHFIFNEWLPKKNSASLLIVQIYNKGSVHLLLLFFSVIKCEITWNELLIWFIACSQTINQKFKLKCSFYYKIVGVLFAIVWCHMSFHFILSFFFCILHCVSTQRGYFSNNESCKLMFNCCLCLKVFN